MFTRLIQIQTWCQCCVLGYSAEVPRYTKASCHLPGVRRPLWWGRVSRTYQGEASSVYQAQRNQDLVVQREGSALVRCEREKWPCFRAIQLSLSQILPKPTGEPELGRWGCQELGTWS